MEPWIEGWLGFLATGCALGLAAAASGFVCRVLLRRRRRLPAALAGLLAVAFLARGAVWLFVACGLMVITGPAPPPEELRGEFALETGLAIPAHWREILNDRSPTDMHGDWSGILGFEVEPDDIDRWMHRRSGEWPRPEDFVRGRPGPSGTLAKPRMSSACEVHGGDPVVPARALLANRRASRSRNLTVAVDVASARLYYCRWST